MVRRSNMIELYFTCKLRCSKNSFLMVRKFSVMLELLLKIEDHQSFSAEDLSVCFLLDSQELEIILFPS
ncbi:unnamed protein product [Moneuplotes crassus]|uniref:Uncharacterized protein n=1 Tax=Euplotes crassus TaxID=5936 RepID=A0AAD2D1G3_EUPCR|nr:unnamed protein product [Moneuplotes crassus]